MNPWLGYWNEFWFRPRTAHTLAVMRIATGGMLAYIHAIWWMRLGDFMGPNALIDDALIREIHRENHTWSYLWLGLSPGWLQLHQGVAVIVALAMSVGWWTRVVTPIAWAMTLMVCHRMTGFLFGLDQIVVMLSMYLMLAPCGAVWSLDAWWRGDRAAAASPWTTVATRLIQIHLCIIYLFGGLAKLRGEMWWDGSAIWFSAVAYEYQSLDLTWIGRYPFLAAVITHVTIFWETFYGLLVWNRSWRPIILGLAVAVHGGIALFLGMVTFGTMMIVANLAFIEPERIERCWNWGRDRLARR